MCCLDPEQEVGADTCFIRQSLPGISCSPRGVPLLVNMAYCKVTLLLRWFPLCRMCSGKKLAPTEESVQGTLRTFKELCSIVQARTC